MEAKLNVQLLEYTPNPERMVAAAARLCYSPDDAHKLMENMTQERVEKFIQKLESLGHGSVFEHINFTFSVSGISRVLSHQLVRHRIASYSQRSQRYNDESNPLVIIPPSILNCPEAIDEFDSIIMHIAQAYDRMVRFGIPKEDARYVLANASETKIVITMNARTLFNFFIHRCCLRAQWEIRALAYEMLRLVKEAAPNVFRRAGAHCTKGYCPEGNLTCGKVPTLAQLIESHENKAGNN